jgi:hypothetical protein
VITVGLVVAFHGVSLLGVVSLVCFAKVASVKSFRSC